MIADPGQLDTGSKQKPVSSSDESSRSDPLLTSDDTNKLHTLLQEAYEAVARDDSFANLGTVGQQLLKLDSAFDTRAYGYKKLGELLKSTGIFVVKGNDVKLKP